MNNLVKIFNADDVELREVENQVWHLAVTACGDPCTLCEGEFYGYGQSSCKYETKQVTRGGITCKKCIEKIKSIKAVKL